MSTPTEQDIAAARRLIEDAERADRFAGISFEGLDELLEAARDRDDRTEIAAIKAAFNELVAPRECDVCHSTTAGMQRLTGQARGMFACQDCGSNINGVPRRRRGRPAIGEPLTVRLPEQARDRLDAEARARSVPVAEIARNIIVDWATTPDR